MKVDKTRKADGIIKECDKERVIYNRCPSEYGYTDNHISSNSFSVCEECWNREVEE